MELDAAKRCFELISNKGLKVSSFISDRHKGIAKWIRSNHPDVQHYHDIWHVCKSITKKLLKAGKEKGNETILLWVKAIRKHLYWCARSTKQGFGDLIVAKWISIVHHISNKHDNHPNISCMQDVLTVRLNLVHGYQLVSLLNYGLLYFD
jgi:hypothetical protein